MATTIYYLSQLAGRRVIDPHGRPVGRLGDLIVRLGGPFPPVAGLTLRLGGIGKGVGPLAAFFSWDQVSAFTHEGITISSARLDLQAFRRRPGELLLDADLLDQQVIDLDGRKLVRVNDVQLVSAGARGIDLRLAGIDVGTAGLLRRLDLGRALGWIDAHVHIHVPDRVIPWEFIEPVDLADLPDEQSSTSPASDGRTTMAHGLQLTHEKLAALHPADVAELVAQLSAPDRAAIFESFEPEMAAETIGELEPEMQADVLEDLSTETAQEILAELPPDEAADALAELSEERAAELLEGLEADDAQDIRDLMAYGEESAGSMMTSAYVALSASLTAQETIDRLREMAPPAEELFYVYAVDEDDRLIGVLSLRDLIVAQPSMPLSALTQDYGEAVRIRVDTPSSEVVETIEKYNLLALPVTDAEDRLVGVVTVDDALASLLPEGESHWLPGMRR